MRVIAPDTTGLPDGFHTLRVHDGCAWMRIPADPASFGLVQRPLETGPQARAAKLPPGVVHRLPRREIARQVAPRAARAQQIKEGIEDRAERVAPEPSMR